MAARSTASSIRSYRDLRVWQVAMDLVIAVYAVTKSLPREGEVETQLEIGRRLEYFTPQDLVNVLSLGDEVSKMLAGLSRSLASITRT